MTAPSVTTRPAGASLAGPRAGLVLLATALAVAAARLLQAPSEALYVAVVGRTGHLPGLDAVAATGVALLLGLVVVVGVVGRRRGPAVLATAVLGVGASGLAYLASEAVKDLVRQPRGCWALAQAADCPPAGDWSFPSNHTTVAVALAVTAALTGAAAGARWVTGPAVLLAAGVAAARVAQGAHLPHDVLAGALLGAGVVAAVLTLLRGPLLHAFAARAR